MLIVLPDWTVELEEKLNKVIKDIAIKYHIDLIAIDDSMAIASGKDEISNALVRLYWKYDLEERRRLEELNNPRRKKNEKTKRR